MPHTLYSQGWKEHLPALTVQYRSTCAKASDPVITETGGAKKSQSAQEGAISHTFDMRGTTQECSPAKQHEV